MISKKNKIKETVVHSGEEETNLCESKLMVDVTIPSTSNKFEKLGGESDEVDNLDNREEPNERPDVELGKREEHCMNKNTENPL